MAQSLSNLIGVVVFAVVGVILDVAVLAPILDSFYLNTTDTTITNADAINTLLGIIPLFVALAILLAVAGSMLAYYKAGKE